MSTIKASALTRPDICLSTTSFFTCLSKDLIDPLGAVLAVFSPETTSLVGQALGFKVRLSDCQLDAIAKLKQRAGDAAKAMVKPPAQVYSHLDFERSSSGSRNIENFLYQLPDLFAAASVKLLDDTGAITIVQNGSRLKIQWHEIAKRAPSYFDAVVGVTGFQTAKISSRDYGKTVIRKLLTLLPTSTGAVEPVARVKAFSANVYGKSIAPLEF